MNLKKRARPQKNLINSNDIEFNSEPFKPDDSYYKLFETGSVLNSTIESTYDDGETLVGSKRRKVKDSTSSERKFYPVFSALKAVHDKPIFSSMSNCIETC